MQNVMEPSFLAPTPVAFTGHVWVETSGSTAYFMLRRRPSVTRSIWIHYGRSIKGSGMATWLWHARFALQYLLTSKSR